MHPLLRALPLLALLLVLSGCAHYVPPGPKADLSLFAPATNDISDNFALKPASPLPATIAITRAQGPRYANFHLSQTGGIAGRPGDRYTLVTVRELDEETLLDRITALPDVAGLTGISRLLLPQSLDTERDLRVAAARLQADLLFLYTLDTSFIDQNAAKPLSVVTLGLSPTRNITAITTASGLLIDTRTGFIHATFETTEKNRVFGTSWSSAESADTARRTTEKAAFAKLVDEFVTAWPTVVARHRAISPSPDPVAVP